MRTTAALTVFAVAALALIGCDETPTTPENALAIGQPGPPGAVVEVAAEHDPGSGEHLFDTSTDEVPSGWTTFRFENDTHATHFVTVQKLPGDRTVEDSRAEVVPVFQEGMDLLAEGRVDEALAEFGELPEWYGQVQFMGGPGLTGPGRSSETTVHLEPGNYVLECYVKTPDGKFHSYVGMITGLTVAGETSGGTEPRASMDVAISAADGIEADGDVRPGTHTVAVEFADQTVHEHFLGHDVHLVRLEDDTDEEELAAWMNWSVPGGLASPAPAEFVGGTHEMPAGETAYVTVRLTPGEYAWIAEVPGPDEKGMLETFTVPRGRTTGR